MNQQAVDVGGCRLVHDRAGVGSPAVLFVHGGGCGRRDWAQQLAGLSDEFTVLAVDLRGHGESAVDDPATCTIPQLASDLHRLLDALGVERAVFVGHSFGCRVVLQAAADRPERTAGVVLVDGSRVWTGTADAVGHRQAGQFDDVRGHYAQIIAAPAFFLHADEGTRERVSATMLSTPEAVLRAIGLSTGPWDAQQVEAVVAAVQAPLLAIQSTYWSDTEPRRPLVPGETHTPWLDMLRRNHRDVRVEILSDIGHFAMIEAADAVNSCLRAFARGTAQVGTAMARTST